MKDCTRICLLVASLCIALAAKKELKEGSVLDSEQEQALPDLSDANSLRELKCGICQGIVMDMAYAINRDETNLKRKLREVEIVEILENVCSHNMNEYGLVLDENSNPTKKWSRGSQTLRAKGGWVTRIAVNACSDIYNEYEEYLVDRAPKSCYIDQEKQTKTCDTGPIVYDICVQGFNWCAVPQSDENKTATTETTKPVDEGSKNEL
uniref:Saposin B-type domain-containing protein n=1 Tax=Guillardia theta TaxID=55529 RepID=A0A7S4L2Y7_GUITH|mmetsp:Transcript_36403/g.113445  ORF Transcript_36403/g.113445 Transcript_36403/m.113445 type:complete len:208 (+) Transcript_36403:35-658(+)